MTVWSVGGDWGDARRRSFLLGLAPALLVLMAITVAPGIYLFLTSLTPLNLTMPDTAWDFSAPHYN
jgi:multiple sugar transport system permease protein